MPMLFGDELRALIEVSVERIKHLPILSRLSGQTTVKCMNTKPTDNQSAGLDSLMYYH
jgi:hypothetical protein